MFGFFKRLFSKKTVEAVDDAVGVAIVKTGKALADAEIQKALANLDDEAMKIGDPTRRAAVLTGIAALRAAVTAFIASLDVGE